MKNFLLVLTLLMICGGAIAQKKKTKRKAVNWTNWSDTTTFLTGSVPLVQSYGVHSDSLSEEHGGVFYTFDNQYYPIYTVGDYYLWFTRKYDFLFRGDIKNYELFYTVGDKYNMARFIWENYKGKKYPIRVSLTVPPLRPVERRVAQQEESDKQREFDKNVSDPVKLSRPKKNN